MSETAEPARLYGMNAQDFFSTLLCQLLDAVDRENHESVASIAKTIAGQAQHVKLGRTVVDVAVWDLHCAKRAREHRIELGSTGEYCDQCGGCLGEFGTRECGCDLTDEELGNLKRFLEQEN